MEFELETGHGGRGHLDHKRDALRVDDSPIEKSGEPPVTGILARLRRLEFHMNRKFGIELGAINRKRPDDKVPVPWHQQLNMALLWISGTLNTSSFATGFFGKELGLSLKQSILVSIFASIVGATLPGFCATFGAATGLRQISVSRYSFGWWPNKLIALLNSIQFMGWAAVLCITGGLALTAVSDGRVSLVLGIVILSITSLGISLIGLNAILIYERYAWIVLFLVFLVIFGETGPHAQNIAPTASGSTHSGALLSYAAIVYGSNASWSTMACDYYFHYPTNSNRTKHRDPNLDRHVAGCVVASGLDAEPHWEAEYEKGLGYLIQSMLYPRAFAKISLSLVVLSRINASVINLYSAAISSQQLARPFALIPRFIWTLFGFLCILGMALGGRQQLSAYLQNFLSLLGYWCTSYCVILFEEHFIFREGSFDNYDLEGWNSPSRLPLGLGASAAFVLGAVSWSMGMQSTPFTGPLARRVGTDGGDAANELTLVVTALSYLPARYLELKYIGREINVVIKINEQWYILLYMAHGLYSSFCFFRFPPWSSQSHDSPGLETVATKRSVHT